MKSFLAAALAVVLLLASGCSSTSQSTIAVKSEAELAEMEKQAEEAHKLFVRNNFPAAERQFRTLAAERTVSQDLYRLELLSTLLMQHKDEEAHKLLLAIHEDLETLTDEKQSEKARSAWHGEQNKVFKGDSYERSTFYALLALSFLRTGNNEDALRSVKNGLLADADSNSGTAVGDNVMLLSIGAFAAGKLKESALAAEYMRGIREALRQRDLVLPENPESLPPGSCFAPLVAAPGNVMLVVWTGTPPTIARAGEYDEKRYVVCGTLPCDSLTLSVDRGGAQLFPQAVGDLNYQATTRGGRLMDGVLADKAEAKKITEVSRNLFLLAGTGLVTAGAIVMNSETITGTCLLGAGGCCYLVGGICWLVGSMMNPEADARYWKNLPYQFFMMPLSLSPGMHTLTVTGSWRGDRTIRKEFRIRVRRNEPVNVIHLSMLVQGQSAMRTIEKACENERVEAVRKADADPLAKELR